MPITARQTTNLNPQEQEGMLSSPSQVISSGSPGFIGGGTTQSPEYNVKGGEQTRSGMFTNIQDYLKANEGAAAPIVNRFEQEAKGIVNPLQRERANVETGLSGLQKNIETAKSGLQSNLEQQQSLKGILGTAQTDPTKLSEGQIKQFRTGISSYGTPDVSKTISEFAPRKTDIFGKQADVLSQARTAQSQLQPMGEISGVKGLIRKYDPGTRTTAGGSSLDAFITRQAPEYETFAQNLQTKLSDVTGTEAKLTPYSKAIQDYLGTGEGSLSSIGSKFDPTLKTGTAFQTQAESLRKLPGVSYEQDITDQKFNQELDKAINKYGYTDQARDEAIANTFASARTSAKQYMTQGEMANYRTLGKLAGKTDAEIDAELSSGLTSSRRSELEAGQRDVYGRKLAAENAKIAEENRKAEEARIAQELATGIGVANQQSQTSQATQQANAQSVAAASLVNPATIIMALAAQRLGIKPPSNLFSGVSAPGVTV